MGTDHSGIDHRVNDNIRFNASRLARIGAVPAMERQDIQQDLVVDLLHRSKKFNPTLASFQTFADRVVAHRISRLTSPTLRLKAERASVSLDQVVVDEEGHEHSLIDIIPDESTLSDDATAMRIDIGRFVKGLTQPLRQSCEILLAGSISEGARTAGIHRSTAHDWIARLRARAAAQGLNEYFASRSDSSAGSPVNDTDSSNLPEPCEMGVVLRTVGVRLLLTEPELGRWLVQARPGEAMTYHRGFLLLDAGQCSRLPEEDRAELARVAERARAADEQGLVHLVQRRHGASDYAYLIVAKPRPPDLSSSPALPISKAGGAQ